MYLITIRAFLKEHSEAGTFVDQYIAAGAYSQRLAQIYENYYGPNKWVDGNQKKEALYGIFK